MLKMPIVWQEWDDINYGLGLLRIDDWPESFWSFGKSAWGRRQFATQLFKVTLC